jgi:hypothetical protein
MKSSTTIWCPSKTTASAPRIPSRSSATASGRWHESLESAKVIGVSCRGTKEVGSSFELAFLTKIPYENIRRHNKRGARRGRRCRSSERSDNAFATRCLHLPVQRGRRRDGSGTTELDGRVHCRVRLSTHAAISSRTVGSWSSARFVGLSRRRQRQAIVYDAQRRYITLIV